MADIAGMLAGKKTYIVSGLGVLGSVLGYLTGDVDTATAVGGVLGSLGLGTVRAGIASAAAQVLAATAPAPVVKKTRKPRAKKAVPAA